MYCWQGKLNFHMLCSVLLYFFSFLFFFSVCGVSHSKAFPLQSKPGRNSHSSNRYVCVVFTHRRNTEGGRNSQRVILAVFELPSKLLCHPRATLCLPHRGLRQRGDRRIPAGLSQSILMEPEVKKPCTGQQDLKTA